MIRFSQRGDTIVEVVIAMTVLGMVLASSYGVANRATRVAQASRDRVEATQIIQQQAEGLRWIRDKQGFSKLESELSSGANLFDAFYLTPTAGDWVVTTVPAVVAAECDNWVDRNVCNKDKYYYYTISPVKTSPNTIAFDIRIDWERIGGGRDTSTINMELTEY